MNDSEPKAPEVPNPGPGSPPTHPPPGHEDHQYVHIHVHKHRPHVHRRIAYVSWAVAIVALLALALAATGHFSTKVPPPGPVAFKTAGSIGGVEITVDSVRIKSDGSSLLVIPTVTVQDAAAHPIFVSYSNFAVRGANGKDYSVDEMALPADALEIAGIAGGESESGTLAFLVPDRTSARLLLFSPNSLPDSDGLGFELAG